MIDDRRMVGFKMDPRDLVQETGEVAQIEIKRNRLSPTIRRAADQFLAAEEQAQIPAPLVRPCFIAHASDSFDGLEQIGCLVNEIG